MARLRIIKDSIDITDSDEMLDKKLLALKNNLKRTFLENKNVFDKFKGEFSIQISGIKIAYVYLDERNIISNQDLIIPRQLIDASISDWKKLKF